MIEKRIMPSKTLRYARKQASGIDRDSPSAFDIFLKRFGGIYLVITAIIAVAGYIVGWMGDTKTSFQILKTSASDAVILQVSSTGPKLKSSTLTGFRLTFNNLPVEGVPLALVKGDEGNLVIRPFGSNIIHLTASGLRSGCRPLQANALTDRYNSEEIKAQLPAGLATLTISVTESNNRIRILKQTVPATNIEAFVLNHLPEHLPATTSCP